MYLVLLMFVVGVFASYLQPVLLDRESLLLLCCGVALGGFRSRTRFLSAALLGLVYANLSGINWLEQRIAADLESTPVTVVGSIEGMPVRLAEPSGWRFRFLVSDTDGQGLAGRSIMIGWRGAPPVRSGERWKLSVRLKRPHGTVNASTFDFTQWMLSQSLHATGQVTAQGGIRLGKSKSLLDYQTVRERIRDRIIALGAADTPTALMLALSIGDSSLLSASDWGVLSATGTNHLFVISGLHVGIVTGLVFFVARKLFHARGLVSTLMALLVAFGYGLLAGFGLPIQRALLMTSVAMLLVVTQRQMPMSRLVLLALAVVLLAQPFSGLSAGLWLSFAAVFGLVLAFSSRPLQDGPKLFQLARTQWIAFASTLPVLVFWWFNVSPIALVVNVFAIPIVTFVLIPILFVFVAALLLRLEVLIEPLANISLATVSGLHRLLVEFSLHAWKLPQVETDWVMALATIGALLFVSPPGFLPRWLGLFCWLPLISSTSLSPSRGQFEFRILDVGQGLSAVFHSADTTLLFDAGAAAGNYNAGRSVVVPSLKQLGVNSIDLFVVSHGDIDHAGGVAEVQSSIPVQETVYGQFGDCRGPRQWEFGETRVRQMMASYIGGLSDNDRSCVVMIESHGVRILLPGDIEEQGERALIEGKSVRADILVAPHHGSATSSSPAFLNRVAPHWVVHSNGYLNRFGHPHPLVTARYDNRGVRQYETAKSGALSFVKTNGGLELLEARQELRRFWYDAAGENAGPSR